MHFNVNSGIINSMDESSLGNKAFMVKLVRTRMPFGRYIGSFLIDLPKSYVVWYSQKGFPKNELGRMLEAVYEIKLNGLEYLFEPLR